MRVDQGTGVPLLLVAGGTGFVGRALRRIAPSAYAGSVVSLARDAVVEDLHAARRRHPGRAIALLLLSWPGLERTGAHASTTPLEGGTWEEFTGWVTALAAAAAANDITLWGVGSGIESVSMGPDPEVEEPYLSYGRRKGALLALLRRQPRLRVHWLRLHFLFGPGEAGHRFVPAAIAACTRGVPLPLDAPDRLRHWMHVDDAARLLLEAIGEGCAGEWDIAGREPISFADLCHLIGSVVGAPLQIVASSGRAADLGCPVVPARAIPDFIPRDVGTLSSLRPRIREYRAAGTLAK